MTKKQWMMESKVGRIYLVASETGLAGIHWRRQAVPTVESLKGSAPEIAILRQAVSELEEYFDGKRKIFSLRLETEGTPFQKKVWSELSKIPYGETCSYRDIAVRVKSPRAVRAVGTANGRNPISIIVPCHRVINASGKLGGYGGGLPIKTKLLELEKRE